MKKFFEMPEIEVELFCIEDVIAISGGLINPGENELPPMPLG